MNNWQIIFSNKIFKHVGISRWWHFFEWRRTDWAIFPILFYYLNMSMSPTVTSLSQSTARCMPLSKEVLQSVPFQFKSLWWSLKRLETKICFNFYKLVRLRFRRSSESSIFKYWGFTGFTFSSKIVFCMQYIPKGVYLIILLTLRSVLWFASHTEPLYVLGWNYRHESEYSWCILIVYLWLFRNAPWSWSYAVMDRRLRYILHILWLY